MSELTILESLSAAVILLRKYELENTSVYAVWEKVYHARGYLDAQMAALLGPPDAAK